MENVFEPFMQQQTEINSALTTGNEDLIKTILQGKENYNQTTQRSNENLSHLIRSNAKDISINTILANLVSSNQNQFSLTHLNGNRFSINNLNPQNVIIKRSTLPFDNGSRYDLNKYDLSYFLSNTKFGSFVFTENDLLITFFMDSDYDTNYGNKKSDRRKLILFLQSLRIVEGTG